MLLKYWLKCINLAEGSQYISKGKNLHVNLFCYGNSFALKFYNLLHRFLKKLLIKRKNL